MFNSRVNRIEKKTSFLFPTTKLKNISCAFCRHEFYIRDLSNLRGSALPLLLNCGHAACNNCVKIHTGDPCPLCPNRSTESESLQNNSLLPVNIYVTGLFGISSARPLRGDEPDISFSQSASGKMKELSMETGLCWVCNAEATVRCLQCNVVYCHTCVEKVHSRLEPSEKHFCVLLTDSSRDSIFEIKRCSRHGELLDYYCNDCDVSGCPHCMLQYHKKHHAIPQIDKNEEYMDDLRKVHGKLGETLQRVRQTQKKLQKNLNFPEKSESNEMVETAINQHFAHLHGVLQNIERRMIDKLYKRRNYFMENLTDIQQRLKTQENQLQSALRMAATVNEFISRINVKDIISELEKLADVPCHLVHDPIVNDEKIVFCPDSSIIEILENHCKIEVPEMSRYSLLPNKTLPIDYQVEPLNTQELPKFMDESFSFNTTPMQRTQSCQSMCRSICSRRSETRALREGSTCLVQLCYIENPSNFYVRQECYRDQIKELHHQLTVYGNHSVNIPSEVQINKLYVIKHATKNKWFRGRVNAINTNAGAPDTYEVFHVDYGSTETQVPSSRMRHIPEKLSSMPQMAINCCLYDIVPIDGKWHNPARKRMLDIGKQKFRRAVTLHIVNIKGNTYYVDICEEQVSIRDSLIFLGHGAFVTSQYLRRTCPQSVRRFLREDMALETYFQVMCSHVESPDCIYVQKGGDNLHYLCTLSNDISNHYNHSKTKFNKGLITVPEIGLPCAVERFEGEWYRGTIEGVPRARMVDVFLVDFGAKITITYDKIRKLNERFMVSPTQAIKVTLTDIKPRAGEWCDDAIQFTKRHIEHKFVRVFAFEKSEAVYDVALYIDDEENHQNFAAFLAGSGLAVSTGPRSSDHTEASAVQSNSKNRKAKVRNARTTKQKKQKSNRYAITQRFSTDLSARDDPYRLLVKIMRAESPDEIFVCDTSFNKEYSQMMTDMQKFYNKYKDESNNCDWQLNSPCAIYSSRDRCFCRGLIVGFKSSDEVQVYLCDLAMTETVPITELQALTKKFWPTPTYVYKVKLAGILPCGGSSVWPSSSCEKLKEIISENQNAKFYISKVVTPNEDTLNVDLWVEEIKIDGALAPARIEMNSINRKLVDIGMALPIKQYNEKKTTVLALELKRQISFIDGSSNNDCIDWIVNGHFKERGNNANQSICDELFVSSESSYMSNEENEEDVSSFLNSSISTEEESLVSTDHTLVLTESKFNAWLPAEPILDDNFIAVPTNLDHNCCVYLHSKDQNANMLRYIEATLDVEYSNLKMKPTDYKWKVGDLCVAQYHGNNKWYRAQVLRVLDNDMIEVEFTDYGNVEECENSTLRRHLTLTHIPRQSTKCVIAGLVPDTPNGKWRIRELDRIHELIVDKECKVFVLERNPDHLVVSIVLLTPTKRDFLPYLINDLRMAVRADISDVEGLNDESESIMDNSDDVIIDGYIKDVPSEHETNGNNEGDIANNRDNDKRDKDDKKSEDGTKKNDIEKNENIEADGIFVTADLPVLKSVSYFETPLTCINDDALSTANIVNATTFEFHTDDAVISGTANFTLSADQIEISQQEAMGKLESESLPDSNSLKEGEIVASTPFNDSLATNPMGYKSLMLPKGLQLVKAEVVLVGLTEAWLHLMDNEKSENISQLCHMYEKIMLDMQDCASDQPVLTDFERNTPCCAKFEDNKWYRCKVLKCLSKPYESEQMVRVRFVDWGNEDNIRSDEIRTLKDEWLEAPCMAFCCRLWGVVEDPSTDFEEIGKMKVRKAWRVEEKPPRPVHVKIKGRTGAFYDVQIYIDEAGTELVYQSLIDDGLLINEYIESEINRSDAVLLIDI